MKASNRFEKINNKILLWMKPEVLDRLRPHMRFIELHRGDIIDEVDGPVEDIYFVNRGLVSVVKPMRDGHIVEVGAIGLEGVTDPTALFGIYRAVLDTMVQIPGSAICITREIVQNEMERTPELNLMLQDYARFAIGQLAQAAACNRLHSLDQRCCRWLLLAHDNSLSDTIDLTHEFLSVMLGARRPGVSIALGALKRAGLIEYAHGRIHILHRHGLEDRACECYQNTQDEVTELYQVR